MLLTSILWERWLKKSHVNLYASSGEEKGIVLALYFVLCNAFDITAMKLNFNILNIKLSVL